VARLPRHDDGERADQLPLLCAEDGPIYQLRRWYEQFYTDVADIPADMVARYEFEVDTSRALQGWEAEVAQNLARRANA
jgi:3-ketosteroid 9alpha-monooxygenase subunit A